MTQTKHQATAFVTGSSGFIGSEVIRQLVARGIRVRALLRKSSSRSNLQGVEFEEVIGDLNDFESLKRGVGDVDYVFHLAGLISAKNKSEFFKHNEKGTASLAQAVSEVCAHKLKRFVYVSSLAAAGPSINLTPRCETDFETPVSSYGASKLGGEKQLLKIAEERFSVTVVRPPAVYGPRDRGVFEFFKYVNKGIMPILPSYNPTNEKYYSLIHVEDLVSGIVQAGLVQEQGRREIYYICDDSIYTWSQVMGSISESLGKNPMRLKVPGFLLLMLAGFYTFITKLTGIVLPLSLDKLGELTPDFWICSNTQAKRKLGFSPRYNLKSGVENTATWYKKHGWL